MEQICEELNIENANTTKCDKSDYKQTLSLACHRKNKDILRALAEGKENCLRIGNEMYGQKEYLQNKCISEARNIYRTRHGQRDFAGNFSKDNKYRKTNWMCQCGQSKEQEIHIISGQCPVYSDIREKYLDFSNDEDLVSYFDEVLARRDSSRPWSRTRRTTRSRRSLQRWNLAGPLGLAILGSHDQLYVVQIAESPQWLSGKIYPRVVPRILRFTLG